MKVGILTQPLTTNYGGLLQAYALQKILENLGHDATTIDRRFEKKSHLKKIYRSIADFIKYKRIPLKLEKEERKLITQHTYRFRKENIKTTNPIEKRSDFSLLKTYDFDAYVVGSDQVWRPSYSPCIENYFLDFVSDVDNRKISYAASFGVDNWEFSPEQTKTCSKLAQGFHRISVREDSGIKLCNQYLNISAELVLDPTMLLSRKDYVELIEGDDLMDSPGEIMTYVLDTSVKNTEIITKVAKELGKKPFHVKPNLDISKLKKERLNDYIYPPVTQWIKGFMDAEFVITDSFHGCVFSIIFNKPFLALGNSKRGLTRFTSLLKLFQLENRLITELEDLKKETLSNEIDFKEVRNILERKRKESLDFLVKSLEQ